MCYIIIYMRSYYIFFNILTCYVVLIYGYPNAVTNSNYIHSLFYKKNYPLSRKYSEENLKRLNNKNITIRDNAMFYQKTFYRQSNKIIDTKKEYLRKTFGCIPPILDLDTLRKSNFNDENDNYEKFHNYDNTPQEERRQKSKENPRYMLHFNEAKKTQESENFHVIKQINMTFNDVGGYTLVKEELQQCVDILKNYEKYSLFNVRIPKGLILEGPPGNGKTLLAKAFAGEANTSFISVAGSDFQEKYVGIGSARVKELFKLAVENKPCIIFIDEIDALGRKRSNDVETSGAERDNTLNQLLVQMDGFKKTDGVFILGATNRADLLDSALLRPGRIDKRIFIGLPDSYTRSEILKIHLNGKPCDKTIILENLVDLTLGMSAAEIENMLNEAMLYTLRSNRFFITIEDVELVINRAIAGWQPNEHQFTEDLIERIAIHEMGHAVIGILMKEHSPMQKIVINLYSPRTPGYTIFKGTTTTLFTKQALFERLMVLLGGRIAEEVCYNGGVTTGAINDFEEAKKLAQEMIMFYGMGERIIYSSNSEKFKTEIDEQVRILINDAYNASFEILDSCKEIIIECSHILKKKKILTCDELILFIKEKAPDVFNMY
jgi:cell division protease FtsH